MTCEECKFWNPTVGNRGDCHLGPQIWNKGSEDWCGSFEKKIEIQIPFSIPDVKFIPNQLPDQLDKMGKMAEDIEKVHKPPNKPSKKRKYKRRKKS